MAHYSVDPQSYVKAIPLRENLELCRFRLTTERFDAICNELRSMAARGTTSGAPGAVSVPVVLRTWRAVRRRGEDGGGTELRERSGPWSVVWSARSRRRSFLARPRHAVADAALVEYPGRARRVVAELGADLLDEGAHAFGVGGFA